MIFVKNSPHMEIENIGTALGEKDIVNGDSLSSID
jgi:hypothetical protein